MPVIGKFYVAGSTIVFIVTMLVSFSALPSMAAIVVVLLLFPGRLVAQFLVVFFSDLALMKLGLRDDNSRTLIDGIYGLIPAVTALVTAGISVVFAWQAFVPASTIRILVAALAAQAFVEHLVRRKNKQPCGLPRGCLLTIGERRTSNQSFVQELVGRKVRSALRRPTDTN